MQDKKDEPDALSFLGIIDREMLAQLAVKEGRNPMEQLRVLIRYRFSGRLKDLGDDRIANPLGNPDELSTVQRPENLRFRVGPLTGGDESEGRPRPEGSKP